MKRLWIFIAICALAIIVYYSIDTAISIAKTPEILRNALNSNIIELQAGELSPEQRKILLAVQDPNFMNHKGVEFSTPGSGWTTITQSIVKKLYFDDFKQGLAKIRQTLIARFALHGRATKEEQLTLFINLMWFDKGVVGFKSASKYFYNKKIDELSEDEFISLVAMIIAPVQYNIRNYPDRNQDRVAKIKRMLSGEYKPKGLFDIMYDQ